MPLSSLEDRHIVITGASRGMGRALALECAAQGARLSICARSSEAVEELANATGAVGGVLDVTDEQAVWLWTQAAVGQYGPVHALINNAAILGPMTPLSDYPLQTFRDVMDTNVAGLFLVTRTLLPHMVRPGGIILHLSSYLGRHVLPRYGAYCASKFAVEGLAQLVAEEHRDEGVISCSVDPGMVQTHMLRAALDQNDVSEFTPPEEVAKAMTALLCSLDLSDTGRPLELFPQA